MNQITTKTMALLGGLLLATPAFAQVDLSGAWGSRMHEDWGDRYHGPDAADYLGLPLNEDSRARALAYSSSQMAMPERMCLQYQPSYLETGPFAVTMWSEDEPVTGRLIAWHINGAGDRSPRTIWMDGRPHPSQHSLHTFGGFSTGVWEGNMLTVYTTHMKAGYLRRNGAPGSDETTITEHFARHGDLLAITAIIEDPVYLTEPHVISRTWVLDPNLQQNRNGGPCYPAVEVARLDASGTVPHYLPGRNPYADEVSQRYNLPLEAVYGGANTLYPEYRKTLKENYRAPTRCVRYCCGWLGTAGIAGNHDAPELNCTPTVP